MDLDFDVLEGWTIDSVQEADGLGPMEGGLVFWCSKGLNGRQRLVQINFTELGAWVGRVEDFPGR